MIKDPGWWASVLAIGGIGIRLTVLLTRAVDSVKELNDSVREVITHVASHETRITKLEAGSKG